MPHLYFPENIKTIVITCLLYFRLYNIQRRIKEKAAMIAFPKVTKNTPTSGPLRLLFLCPECPSRNLHNSHPLCFQVFAQMLSSQGRFPPSWPPNLKLLSPAYPTAPSLIYFSPSHLSPLNILYIPFICPIYCSSSPTRMLAPEVRNFCFIHCWIRLSSY